MEVISRSANFLDVVEFAVEGRFVSAVLLLLVGWLLTPCSNACTLRHSRRGFNAVCCSRAELPVDINSAAGGAVDSPPNKFKAGGVMCNAALDAGLEPLLNEADAIVEAPLLFPLRAQVDHTETLMAATCAREVVRTYRWAFLQRGS